MVGKVVFDDPAVRQPQCFAGVNNVVYAGKRRSPGECRERVVGIYEERILVAVEERRQVVERRDVEVACQHLVRGRVALHQLEDEFHLQLAQQPAVHLRARIVEMSVVERDPHAVDVDQSALYHPRLHKRGNIGIGIGQHRVLRVGDRAGGRRHNAVLVAHSVCFGGGEVFVGEGTARQRGREASASAVEVVGVHFLESGDVDAAVVELGGDRIYVFEGVAAAPDVVGGDGERDPAAACCVDAAFRVEQRDVGHRQTGNREKRHRNEDAYNADRGKDGWFFHNFLLNSIVLQNGALVAAAVTCFFVPPDGNLLCARTSIRKTYRQCRKSRILFLSEQRVYCPRWR